MSPSYACAAARAWSRLATATRSTFADACAPGMTFRLMSAVETIPHFTASATCVLSPNGGDRRRHARLRVHGQGPLERVQEDPVRHVAAAARAEAARDRRTKHRGGAGGGAAIRLGVRDLRLARAHRRRPHPPLPPPRPELARRGADH